MSKGNMLLGYSRGKVGSLVFARLKGQQITRAYNAKPFNRKSLLQQVQRSKMGNLTAFYRALVALLDHSFTSRSPFQSSYNSFIGENLRSSSVFLTRAQVNNGACVVAPYIISKGTLPPIETTGTGDSSLTNISVGSLGTVSQSTTVAQFAQALIDNNANIQEGDQLSYISVVQTTNSNTSMPQIQSGLYEVTLSLTDDTPLLGLLPAQAVAVRNGFLAHGTHVSNGGFAWILSRRVNGVLACSTQRLILNSDSLYITYSSNAQREIAAVSYGANPEPFLVPNEGNVASTPSVVGGTPSVASLSFDGTTLTSSTPARNITAGQHIIAVFGSELSSVNAISVLVGSSRTPMALTIDSQEATKIGGSVTFSSAVNSVSRIEVLLDGVSQYVWNGYVAPPSGGGGGNDDD